MDVVHFFRLCQLLLKERAELCAELDDLMDVVSKELTKGLFEALKENNFEKVQSTVQGLKKINPAILKNGLLSDSYNLDPLTFALIQEVDVAIIKYLLQQGAPVDPKHKLNNFDLLEILVSQTYSAFACQAVSETYIIPRPLAVDEVKDEACLC